MRARHSKPEPLAELRRQVEEAATAMAESPSNPRLSRPPEPGMGDYSSNAAMMLAGTVRSAPCDVAASLSKVLATELGDTIERVEVAGPGFLNLFVSDSWLTGAVAALAGSIEAADRRESGRAFEVGAAHAAEGADRLSGLGPEATETPERFLVEFVSANPTGPLTAASGRHGAFGDAVCRLLEAVGHEVGREYYVNDAGGQIERLAESIAAAMTGGEPPEDGYTGEYVEGLARRFAGEGTVTVAGHGGRSAAGAVPIELPIDPADLDRIGRAAVAEVLAEIGATLEAYRVRFDRWVSERELHESGAVSRAIDDLTASGHTYESEGATWLRTTEFGDDKDRVLVRSGGEPTYFAADVAYHAEKLSRGFQRLVDVLGADHHGYLGRMEAAIATLGARSEAFEVQIMQMLSIVEGGERTQMSKRRGDYVGLQDLIDEIGTDATRYFMLHRSHDTAFDLDLELAKRESSENPVYYVQYAHARIASILRRAAAEGAIPGVKEGEGAAREREVRELETAEIESAILAAGLPDSFQVSLEPAERELVKRLLELPDEVREAADRRSPHRICAYATAIASDFHAFYRDCKVVGAGSRELEEFRLTLSLVAKRTLAATLGLLGITAPERM